MRRFGFVVTVCAALVLAPGASLSGQVEFDGTLFGGGAFFLQDASPVFGTDGGLTYAHDNGFGLGAHAGARLGGKLSLEGTLAYVPTEIAVKIASGPQGEVATDQNVMILTGNVLYNFRINFNWDGFLGAGAGIKSYSADDPLGGVDACGGPCAPQFEAGSDFTFSVGGGVRLHFSDRWAARLDVRDYISTFDAFELTNESGENTQTQHDVLATIGISYAPTIP